MGVKGRPLSFTCKDWCSVTSTRVAISWSRVDLGIFNCVEEDTERGLIRTERLSSCWSYSVVLKYGIGTTGEFEVLSGSL